MFLKKKWEKPEKKKKNCKAGQHINWLGPALNWGLDHILCSMLWASGLYSAGVKKKKN